MSPPTAPWKVNRPGGRARPLSDARLTPWRSSRPPSSHGWLTEWQGARLETGGRVYGPRTFDPSTIRTWRVNLPGGGRRPESGRARGSALGLKTSALCSWMVNRSGGRRPFEAGWGARAPGAQDLRHLLAATQPVDGACPINRCSAVRLRGGQPWRDSSAGRAPRP